MYVSWELAQIITFGPTLGDKLFVICQCPCIFQVIEKLHSRQMSNSCLTHLKIMQFDKFINKGHFISAVCIVCDNILGSLK